MNLPKRRKKKKVRYDILNKVRIVESDDDDEMDYYECDDGTYDPSEIEAENE